MARSGLTTILGVAAFAYFVLPRLQQAAPAGGSAARPAGSGSSGGGGGFSFGSGGGGTSGGMFQIPGSSAAVSMVYADPNLSTLPQDPATFDLLQPPAPLICDPWDPTNPCYGMVDSGNGTGSGDENTTDYSNSDYIDD